MNPEKYRVLDADAVEKVHQATLKILANPGIHISDPKTVQLLTSNGATAGANGYICFSEKVLQKSLSSVPNNVKLYNRAGNLAVETNGNKPYFSTGLFCRDILDHNTHQKRSFLFKDIKTVTQVCDRLPHINLVGSLGFPTDIPVDTAAQHTIKEVLEWTEKPVFFYGNDEYQAKEIWETIAEKSGGWDHLTKYPCGLDLVGPTSPLALDDQACQRLIFNATHNLPTVCFSAVIPGASGPVTLAGALVQASAESLAGIVLHQLVKPGAPILSGSNVMPMDMRTGNLAYASAEYNLVCQAAVDYYDTLGIPTWIGAGHSDAHTVDIQAASEIGMNMNMAAFSSSTLIHNLGYLSSGKTASLEMLVLGNELAGATTRLKRGIRVDDESLAVSVIEEEGLDNGFLKSAHTLKHCRTENYTPKLFDRESHISWQQKGEKPMDQRISETLKTILEAL
jgi:trimethylamine---corrinoid protein Co-methyltransferase